MSCPIPCKLPSPNTIATNCFEQLKKKIDTELVLCQQLESRLITQVLLDYYTLSLSRR